VTVTDGVLTITCATEGASIGWRTRGDDKRWRVYVEPVKISSDQTYEAVAHRIGFKRSAITAVPATK
jgi:hypothetical protein